MHNTNCNLFYDLPSMHPVYIFLFIQSQTVALMEVYKIYAERGPLYLHDMFLPEGNVKHLRNHINPEQRNFSTSTYSLNSFSYNGARLLNNL